MSRSGSASKSASFSTINVDNFQPFLHTKASKNSQHSFTNSDQLNPSASTCSTSNNNSPNLDSPLLTSCSYLRNNIATNATSSQFREDHHHQKSTFNQYHTHSTAAGGPTSSSSPRYNSSLHETNPILTFNANFESGNLGKVEAVNHFEYNLEIRQDSNNQKFRLWYYFSVEGFKKNQVALFNITNFSKGRSLYRTGQSPLVKINDGKWVRLNPSDCWYYKPEKGSCYCLSYLFKFPDLPPVGRNSQAAAGSHPHSQPSHGSPLSSTSDFREPPDSQSLNRKNQNFANISVPPNERQPSDSYPFANRNYDLFGSRPPTVQQSSANRNKIYFAYCFPYTYSKLQNFLDKVTGDPKNGLILQRELVAMSAQRRRIELLTISSPQNLQKMAAIEKSQEMSKSVSNTKLEKKLATVSNFNLVSNPNLSRLAGVNFERDESNREKASESSAQSTLSPTKSSISNKPPLSVPASFNSPTSNLISTCSSYVPIVFVSARVHPGETPSSIAMEEFIRYLLSSEGKNLRNVAVFKIVPMINPDGVAIGNYRCSSYGYDLNRCYQDPSAWAMPEIFGIRDVVEKYLYTSEGELAKRLVGQSRDQVSELPASGATLEAGRLAGTDIHGVTGNEEAKATHQNTSSASASNLQNPTQHNTNTLNSERSSSNFKHAANIPKAKLELYIDIHGHSLLTNSFIYGNLYDDDQELSEKQHILPKILDKISQDFSIKNSSFNCDSCKSGSGRRTFENYNHCLCYTLEISMSHYFSKFSSDGIFYTESRYGVIGVNLARAMEHYFSIRRPGRKSIAKSGLSCNKGLIL